MSPWTNLEALRRRSVGSPRRCTLHLLVRRENPQAWGAKGLGMHSKDDKGSVSLPWFRRFRSDGRMETHVTRGDEGEILIIDDDGWAASFKKGKWYDGIVFAHEQVAEFAPVQDRDEIYRLFSEAHTALGAKDELPE